MIVPNANRAGMSYRGSGLVLWHFGTMQTFAQGLEKWPAVIVDIRSLSTAKGINQRRER
jgi:hypothetical protein